MDGDGDRDPHWSTGLSSQCPKEEQKEGNMSKEVRTTRGAPTHGDSGADRL
ncbi:hypothetical protein ACRRTK_001983 [Alexandromys fortis]